MAAGPGLRNYGSNLSQTNQNIRESRKVVKKVDNKIDQIKMAIDAVDKIEEKADEFRDTIVKQKLVLKLMDKAGPLKFLAKIATKLLNSVERVTEKVRDKAKALAKKIDEKKLEEKLDSAQEKLEKFDNTLEGTGLIVLKNIVAANQLVTALDKVDEFAEGDPAAPAAEAADSLVAQPNVAISAINDAYAGIKEKTQALDNATPSASFVPVLSVRLAFDSISSSLAFLRGPLDAVSKALKPIEGVLDAIGFIFNITVGPVIDFIMDKLGIDDVINSVNKKISKLLPNPDVLDNVLNQIDTAFLEIEPLGQLDDYLGITEWLDEVSEKLLNPVGDPQTGPIGIGDPTDDVLRGTANNDLLDGGDGNDTLLGEAGDDVLLAGPGNDIIDGGEGNDIAVFRGNFTEYAFSKTTNEESIVFNHLNPINPRIFDGKETVNNVETYNFADFSLTHSQLLNSIFVAEPGQTVLMGTGDQDFLFGGSTAININALSGNDILAGSSASGDILNGEDGDDILVNSGGSDTFNGGNGRDTWRFPVNNESGNPDIDADLERNTIRISQDTATLIDIENILVEDNREAILFGDANSNRLVAAGGRDVIDGRGGNDLLDGGPSQDILIGAAGSDALYGGEGNDSLVSGERTTAGVNNFYDGGEGDFDQLTYVSNIRDIVSREYINDGLRLQTQSQESSGPVRIFAETGFIERLSDDGSTVVATDTAVNVERFVGSDANDEMFGGPGTYSEIDGGPGNDTLYGQLAGRFVGGGEGDDKVYAGLGGANYEGGGGFDTLYLTEVPDVRWLVRLDGSIGSSLRAFNALEGNELATPDGSLQNESGASVLASGNVGDFDVYYSGNENDYFDLRDRGLIIVHAADGDDFLRGNNGGSNGPSFELYGELGDDEIILKEVGIADGGEGEDRIQIDASTSATTRAFGGLGDDVILIRSGQTIVNGGEGYDVLAAADQNPLAGLNVDLAANIFSANNSDRFSGSVVGVEELIGSDEHADILRGSDAGERLIGAGGNDRLEGRGNQDALYGGAGNDNLQGGTGNDQLHGGAGNDVIDGGSGIDTASWAFAAPGSTTVELENSTFGQVEVDLNSGTAHYSIFNGGSETDSLNSIENVVGGDGNDTIRGSNEDNMLAGGAGEDILDGRSGNDVLVLEGNDTASGGDGDDLFAIGLGNMSIDGGTGFDTLDFGTLRGTIRVDQAAGTYEATFETDKPVWTNDLSSSVRTANGKAFTPVDILTADSTYANSADDLNRIVPEGENFDITFVTVSETSNGTFTDIEQFISGTAKLIGSAADDQFMGDAGNNIFEGLQGNNTFDGGDGADTVIFSNPLANYSIVTTAQGVEITNLVGNDDANTLTNIERFKFSDIGFAYDLNGDAGEVAKLIGAVYGAPSVTNKNFVGIGLGYKNDGMSYNDLGALAMDVAGKSTPEDIVTLLWTNIIGSAPSTGQAQPYVDMLNNGTSVGELVVLAADTDLNQIHIDLVGLSSRGIEFV